MANYAVVKEGVVVDLVIWDGVVAFSVEGATLVEATADTIIGGTYDGSSFTYVAPSVPDLTSAEEAAAVVRASAVTKLKALGLTDAEVAAIKEVL